jgi:hypothetical protein
MAYEKLTEKYTSMYTCLDKMTSTNTTNSQEGQEKQEIQSIVQCLSRENQELQRKVKLYGFQHLEDKKMIGNLKKKIKGLKNEIETLQHLNSTNTNTSTSTSSTSTSINGGGDITMLSPSVFTTSINTTTTASSTTTSSNSNENYQYIDPNILKMLEKVDSQFSIANAINLSMSLKKWFHTCLNICSSIHFGKILQTILFNLCEMLHAEQAILFEVDYTKPHKLIAKYTKEGEIYKELPLEKGLLGHVIQTRKSINIKKAYEDARFYSPTDSILGFHTHDVLCIPIESEQKSILGVLQVANTKTRQGFSLIDQILAGLFGTQAGIVLVQNQLETNLLKNNDKLIKILDLPSQITRNCLSITSPKPNVNLVRLLFTAQKKFTEIVGIKKIKVSMI